MNTLSRETSQFLARMKKENDNKVIVLFFKEYLCSMNPINVATLLPFASTFEERVEKYWKLNSEKMLLSTIKSKNKRAHCNNKIKEK